MSEKLKPRNALVSIRVLEREEQKTTAGLIVPQMAGNVFSPCEIVEVGRGTPELDFRDTNDLVAGMRVLARIGSRPPMKGGAIAPIQYTALPMNDEKTVLLLNQSDIFGVLPEPEGGWPDIEVSDEAVDEPEKSGLILSE